MKKRFIVEIDVPEETGDLCWDRDVTGLQVLHDCIVSVLPEVNVRRLAAAYGKPMEFQKYTDRLNSVRESFKVIKPLESPVV